MQDDPKLRGKDIILSILFFVLGVYILIEAFQMPLKDTYAGVTSKWYVSPALLPLIIGFAIILLAFSILRHALKHGGKEALRILIGELKESRLLSDHNVRYAGVLIPLLALVYVNLRMVDFYLALVLYLGFTIPVFYLDDKVLTRKLVYFYFFEMLALTIIRIFNVHIFLNKLFYYFMDSIIVLMLVALIVKFSKEIKGMADSETQRKKFKQAMLVSWITPLVVVIIFKYLLRVPLPKEGVVVNLMSMIYYKIR